MTLPVPAENQPASPPLASPVHIRLPMWKLSFLLLAAPKLLLYASVAIAAIFFAGRRQREMLTAEGLATLALFTGVGLGVAYLWRLSPRPAHEWLRQVWTSRAIRIASTGGLGYANRLVFHVHHAHVLYWSLIAGASAMIFLADIVVTRRALAGRIGLAQDALVEPAAD